MNEVGSEDVGLVDAMLPESDVVEIWVKEFGWTERTGTPGKAGTSSS